MANISLVFTSSKTAAPGGEGGGAMKYLESSFIVFGSFSRTPFEYKILRSVFASLCVPLNPATVDASFPFNG